MLGTVVALSWSSVTVLTKSRYLLAVDWDGTMSGAPVFYSESKCGGEAYLDSGQGQDAEVPLYARTVLWLQSPGSFAVPVTIDDEGWAGSVNFKSVSIDGRECREDDGGARNGWLLTPTTAEKLGLPEDAADGTVATPLTLG